MVLPQRKLMSDQESENARLRSQLTATLGVLSAIAGLARGFPRPSGSHDLCRVLSDIEGIAREDAARIKQAITKPSLSQSVRAKKAEAVA